MPACIKRLDENDISQAAETLFEAFRVDPLMSWIFDSPKHYDQYGKAVITSWVKFSYLYGRVYHTEDFKSVMLLRSPGHEEISFWRAFRSGALLNVWQLGKKGFGRLMQFEEKAKQAKQEHLGDSHFWYVWMLGTLPSSQGKGLGTILLNKVMSLSNKDAMPIYLETLSPSAATLYKRHRFKSCSFFSLTDDRDVHTECMKREPTRSL